MPEAAVSFRPVRDEKSLTPGLVVAIAGADSLTALLWGVLLHGEAGEVLSRKVGPVGFLARQIPDEIPALLAR